MRSLTQLLKTDCYICLVLNIYGFETACESHTELEWGRAVKVLHFSSCVNVHRPVVLSVPYVTCIYAHIFL